MTRQTSDFTNHCSFKQAPTVSVLMPVFNGADFIQEAIQSILAQSFADLELLVLDDGSVDATAQIVSGFTDHRVRYFHFQHLGVASVLNQGIELSRGQYIARMDADDIADPLRLEKQLYYLRTSGADIVFALGREINEVGKIVSPRIQWLKNTDEIDCALPDRNALLHPTCMLPQAVFENFGYDKTIAEDYCLWLKLWVAGKKIAVMDEVLLSYRRHSHALFCQLASDKYRILTIPISAKFFAARWALTNRHINSRLIRLLLHITLDCSLLLPRLALDNEKTMWLGSKTRLRDAMSRIAQRAAKLCTGKF